MSKPRKSPFQEAQEQIDLRLGGLLGELGAALNEAIERLDGQGAGEVHTEHTFDSGRGPVRASAGIRIRTLGGTPSATTRATDQPINTPQKTARSPQANPPRPISATILDGSDRWQLIAELPGVDKAGVTMQTTETELTIAAEGRGRQYASSFEKPQGAAADDFTLTIQNGILEVTFEKPEAQS